VSKVSCVNAKSSPNSKEMQVMHEAERDRILQELED
jgi:hypothetical protein